MSDESHPLHPPVATHPPWPPLMSKAFIRELKIGDQFISSRGLRIFTVKVIDVGVYATTITGSGRWFTKKYVIDQIEKSERSRKEADKLLYE